MTELRIEPDDRLFNIFVELFMAYDAVFVAIKFYLAPQNVHVDGARHQLVHAHVEGDYAAVESRLAGKEIHVPVHGPVIAALHGKTITHISTDIVDIKNKAAAKPDFQTDGFVRFAARMTVPYFVTFFENHRETIEEQFGTNPYDWPECWNFARVVRNSIAHNETVHFRNMQSEPVSWNGFTLSPTQNGEDILDAERALSGGDLIFLLLDLDAALE